MLYLELLDAALLFLLLGLQLRGHGRRQPLKVLNPVNRKYNIGSQAPISIQCACMGTP